jgi:TonB family protein
MTKLAFPVVLLLGACAATPPSPYPGQYAEQSNRGVLAKTVVEPPKNDEERQLAELMDQLFAGVPGFRPYKEDIGKSVVYPKVIHAENPVYPFRAKLHNVSSTVKLAVLVDRDGNVADVKLLSGSNQHLNDAAVTAMRKWKFSPGLLDGKPDFFVFVFPIVFSLGT